MKQSVVLSIIGRQSYLDQEPEQLELLLIPGGMGSVYGMQGSPAARELVRNAVAQDRWVAAICAAPTVLAGMGLLEGKRAVCYPDMKDQMAGAEFLPDTEVAVSGRIITGQAAGSAFSFGLKLVEALWGAETAEKVRKDVHYHHE